MEEDSITDINVTPLVDVCLVLVIIFMAVAPFMYQSGIQVTGSKMGASKGRAALDQNVNVVLDAVGVITINGKKILWEHLAEALAENIAVSKDRLVTIQAAPSNRVGQVVEILDQAKQNGAKKVAILRK